MGTREPKKVSNEHRHIFWAHNMDGAVDSSAWGLRQLRMGPETAKDGALGS